MVRPDNILKWCIGEALIVVALLFILNNYMGYEKKTIKADGQGYYEYLPALFIYGDFPCRSDVESQRDYSRINEFGFYLEYKGERINKYPCGTAVLISPFFCYAHLTAKSSGFANDGFSRPYQNSVFYAAVFYLFLGLVFLRKLLKLYHLHWGNIFLMQFLIVFATSLVSYVNYDSAFSHVYSFFALTAFLFFVKAYFTHKQIKYFIWACVFLGLVIILRPVNVIIILFIPFLAGSFENLKAGIVIIFQRKWALISGLILTSCIVFLQLYLWHYQTGEYLVYSYQGEGFHFLAPAFFKILFSYQKGLFVYTPITFIALAGCLVLLKKKEFYLFFTWITFFVILTYVLSSWEFWTYGGSFGLRAYIDFYAIFFILLGLFIENVKTWLKLPIIMLSLLTVPVCLIQTKQYKEYILLWNSMDKYKYWTVFLRREERFRGIFWKKIYNFNSQTTKIIYSASIPDVKIGAHAEKELYTEYSNNIEGINNANIIQVKLANEFNLEQDAYTELYLKDTVTGKIYFFNMRPIIHYGNNEYNKFQLGEYNFEFSPVDTANVKRIYFKIHTINKEVEIKNIELNFLSYH